MSVRKHTGVGFDVSLALALRILEPEAVRVLQLRLAIFDPFLRSPAESQQFGRLYLTLFGALKPPVMRHAFGIGTAVARHTGMHDALSRLQESFAERLAEFDPLEKVARIAGDMAEGREGPVNLFIEGQLGCSIPRQMRRYLGDDARLRAEFRDLSGEALGTAMNQLRGETRADLREELWKNLRSFAWWNAVEPEKRVGRLRSTVWRDAFRTWRQRRRAERGEQAPFEPGAALEPPQENVVREDLSRHALARLMTPRLPERYRLLSELIIAGSNPIEAAKAVGGTSPKATWIGYQNAFIRRFLSLDEDAQVECLAAMGVSRAALPSMLDRLKRRVGH